MPPIHDKPKTIGIVGSRSCVQMCHYEGLIKAFDKLYREGDMIVSGGCPIGGDAFAERIARERGIPILIHYPDWGKYGKRAGFIRNTKIAESCDILLAIVAPNRSSGTEDTIWKCKCLKKKVILIEESKDE